MLFTPGNCKRGVFAEFPLSDHTAGTKEMRARTWRHLAPYSDFLSITFRTVMTKSLGKSGGYAGRDSAMN